MNLVQSLTGPTTTTTTSSGDLSPAARLASIENTTPSPKETQKTYFNNNAIDNYDEISRILDETNYFPSGSSYNNIPSILSPAPAMLPPASPPGLFSPAVADPFIQAASNMFIPSPSTLYSAPMVSPSPSSSSYHYYSSIFDF
ncbi:hypothetical protein Leryth_009416 [Lithospermum erythrorhizon]|nr:hypothetical protein Leryth_009416 [Lithospermum erythrorhizon]